MSDNEKAAYLLALMIAQAIMIAVLPFWVSIAITLIIIIGLLLGLAAYMASVKYRR